MPNKAIANNGMKIQLKTATITNYTDIPDVTELGVSVSNDKQTTTPFGLSGWKKSYITGKEMTISFTTIYNVGNEISDFLMGLLVGDAINQNNISFKITWPTIDGQTEQALEFDASVEVTQIGSDATEVQNLQITCNVIGKPNWQPYTTV